MKHAIKLTIMLLTIFVYGWVYGEGFVAGTLVKIPGGYVAIENLCVGDRVICLDTAKRTVEGLVTYTGKKIVHRYACIQIGNECINVACDQQFYSAQDSLLIPVSSIGNRNILSIQKTKIYSIKFIEESINVYLLGVAEYHNFFVTCSDICAHNFIPAAIVGISLLFGSGTIEIAGVSFGIAGLGTYFGYKWHKKNKQKHDFVVDSMLFDKQGESKDIYNTDDAQAPGKPTENDGFHPPKKWDGKKVKNPNGHGVGWPDAKGHVWIPTGPKAHRGPHWDVQDPKTGRHRNVLPGGRVC